MSRTADLGWAIVEGRAPAPNPNKGACQSNARQIVERALGFSTYGKYPVPGDPRYGGDITASTAEQAWREAGLAVGTIRPGALLYSPGDSPAGHVGVALGKRNGTDYVLEVTYAPRGVVIGGQQWVRLTPLSKFGTPRTIIFFPEDTQTPQDARETGEETSSPPTPAPAPPGRPDAPLSIPLVDLVNAQGAPSVPQSAKVDTTSPMWIYNTLDVDRDRAPAVLPTNLGPVSSLVILRAPYEEESAYSMPVLGPISVAGHEWRDTLRKTWGSLKRRYMTMPESWGRYFAPLMELSLNPARYRLPLPDVSEITLEQDVGGNAWAEVTLHVGDHDAAEAIVATLALGQRYRNLLTEIWLPVTVADPHGGERSVLQPLHVGVIDEVVVSSYPHSIRVRVVAQDAAMNAVGMDPEKVRTHWEKATIAQIIEDIAADHKLLIVTASAPTLADVPALQRVLPSHNTLGLPPMDALRHLVERAGGLRFQRLAGTELAGYRLPGLPRGVWAVVDPTAYHFLTPGFWKSAIWSRVFAPLAAAALPGHDPVGEVAVLFPADLPDPKVAARISALLETYGTPTARRNPLYKFLDALSAIGAAAGIGSGPAVYRAYTEGETRSALLEFLNSWWTAAGSDAAPRVAKLMVPVLTVEELAVRSPDSSQISAPLFGTSVGSTLQGRRVQAREAGALMGLEAQPDGTFLLSTPGGPGKFKASEVGTVYYGRHYSRPSLFAPAPAGAQDVERVPDFYPNTLRVSVKPTAGVRVGMLAAVVGLGRIDGLYQIQGAAYALSGTDQTLTLTLRTQRDLWGV